MTDQEVKKTAKSFENAWELGYLYKLMDVSLKEIKTNIKEGKVNKKFFDNTKEKIDALRLLEKTTHNEALKHKAKKHALEMEAYLKEMGLVLKS